MSDKETSGVAIISKDDLSLSSENNLNGKQLNLLLSKTPAQYVSTRPAKGGGVWTYVTGGYMKKVLNLMFGWDWDFEVRDSQILHDQVIVLGMLTCRSSNGKAITKMQYGCKDIAYYKDRSKGPLNIGNDFKAASTDALKKCASEIGIAADIYNKEEFREVKVASEENPNLGESEAIKKGVESALKKVKGDDTVEESVEKTEPVPEEGVTVTGVEVIGEVEIPEMKEATISTEPTVTEVVLSEEDALMAEKVRILQDKIGDSGELPPTETTPEKEPIPPTPEPMKPDSMTQGQHQVILELLKADDFPDGYVDNVMKELSDFDHNRAQKCIDYISAKKYLPEGEIPPTETPEESNWNPEWGLYTEDYLKVLGTTEEIYKILTARGLELPEKKHKTNKLLRETILNHQKETAPEDAKVYAPPTEEPEAPNYEAEPIESVSEVETTDVMFSKKLTQEEADSLKNEGVGKKHEAPTQDEPEAKVEETPAEPEKAPESPPESPQEVVAEIQEEKQEIPPTEEIKDQPDIHVATSGLEPSKPKLEAPTPQVSEILQGDTKTASTGDFEKALLEIESPPNGTGREFVPLKQVWNLLDEHGVDNDNAVDIFKKMGIDKEFGTREDFCRDGSNEQIIEFMKQFKA